MSCIYRDPYNRLVLMCKGADSVITDNLSEYSKNSTLFSKTSNIVNAYAAEGLRTLFLAEKFLT